MTEFASTDLLLEIIKDQKKGIPRGVFSICSANPFVLKASMQFAKDHQTWVSIESTCNQVNQDGGYTGMVPAEFVESVRILANAIGVPENRVLLGGDHLGPNPWKHLPADVAMLKAVELVEAYVQAGYRKIHLDCSMACADDPDQSKLDLKVEADRAARLCAAAESAFQQGSSKNAPVYIIGTEVPVPGGVEGEDEGLQITSPQSVEESLSAYHTVFEQYNIENVWDRVIGFVVQPGVEFGHFDIHDYDPSKAAALSAYIKNNPTMVYEAHSTDYQLPYALKKLVVDHFAILKVGPALTFAFREAVYALAQIEKILFQGKLKSEQSSILEVVDRVMVEYPQYWKNYYLGNADEQAVARMFSFSDRIRYYWPDERVEVALYKLIENLSRKDIPLVLISQFMPEQHEHIRGGVLKPDPEALIYAHIKTILYLYHTACMP